MLRAHQRSSKYQFYSLWPDEDSAAFEASRLTFSPPMGLQDYRYMSYDRTDTICVMRCLSFIRDIFHDFMQWYSKSENG